jgi:hypothetical protein
MICAGRLENDQHPLFLPSHVHSWAKPSTVLGRLSAASWECQNASRRSFDTSIPMVSLAISSFYLCLSFGPGAHVSVQVVRKDGGSPNSTAVLQDQAPHGAASATTRHRSCGAGLWLPLPQEPGILIRQAPPSQNTLMPCAGSRWRAAVP